jgi:uncharacterized protein
MTQTQIFTPPHPYEASDSDASLRTVLADFPGVELAFVFGSVAQGRATSGSDLDIAVGMRQVMSAEQKMALIAALAIRTGRPVDLIDLNAVGQPLLGQIVMHGRRLLGSAADHGRLISRHLVDAADFMPLRNRILKERRAAWIGK